jgi:hypothetical protein
MTKLPPKKQTEMEQTGKDLWKLGIVTSLISLVLWPFVYVFGALQALNNPSGLGFLYVCAFGPGVGIAIGIFTTIFGLCTKDEGVRGEESGPKVLSSEEQARENKFSQASNLDQRGDWSKAIALYEQIAEESQGQRHTEYARNCAQQIREKML